MITFEDSNYKRLSEEFKLIDSRLSIIIYAISGFMNRYMPTKVLCIIDIHRLDPGSVHHYWRAVDMRTKHLTKEEGNEIYAFIEKSIQYDPNRPDIEVVHDERELENRSPLATGEHFHIQVDPNNLMKFTNTLDV